MSIEHQLVFQLPTASLRDLDLLATIEEALQQALGELGLVDGHDIGSGEMNVFIFTEAPELASQRCLTVFRDLQLLGSLRGGVREVGTNEFQAVWPRGATGFRIV